MREVLERLDPRAAGNIDSWIVPQREAQSLRDRAQAALEPIVKLSPQAISLHPSVASAEVWLRFRGLAIAKWDDGRVFFGISERRDELTAASWPELKKLLRDLERRRQPLATDVRHPLYRAPPERWLEASVRADVTRIDAQLDPRFVYTQVFANAGGEQGIYRPARCHSKRTAGDSGIESDRTYSFGVAGCRLLAPREPSPETQRSFALRIFSRCAIASGASVGISGRPGSAFSSRHGRIAKLPGA